MEPWKPERIIRRLQQAFDELGTNPRVAQKLDLPIWLVGAVLRPTWDPLLFLENLRLHCKDGDGKEGDVARAFGVSQGYIASLVNVAENGCPTLLQALGHGTVNITTAKKIARIPDGRLQRGLIRRLENAESDHAANLVKLEIDRSARSRAPYPRTVHELHQMRRALLTNLKELFPDIDHGPDNRTEPSDQVWSLIHGDTRPEVAHWLGLWKGVLFALGEITEDAFVDPDSGGTRWGERTVRTIRSS